MDAVSPFFGTLIQAAGIAPLAVLSLLLTRSIRRRHLYYWSAAWACLSAALLVLFFSCQAAAPLRLPAQFLYFLGEYVFGYLFIAGCRHYVTGDAPSRRELWLLPPAVLSAAALAGWPAPFPLRFVPQSAILAAVFAACLRRLWPLRRTPRTGPGLSIVLAALALLVLDFLLDVPVLLHSHFAGRALPPAYTAYTSIADMLLEVLLGFGTVTLAMEDVNRELRAARERVELAARVDPLTESLNRHAFHSLLQQQGTNGSPQGSVVVVDIDELKPINDSYGHAAGDAAIRAVAGAIRGLVRADDLIFRWGGDEFLILLFGLAEAEARRRMSDLDPALRETYLPGAPKPVPVRVSYGIAAISPGRRLEQAIDAADDAMYRLKQKRKARRALA